MHLQKCVSWGNTPGPLLKRYWRSSARGDADSRVSCCVVSCRRSGAYAPFFLQNSEQSDMFTKSPLGHLPPDAMSQCSVGRVCSWRSVGWGNVSVGCTYCCSDTLERSETSHDSTTFVVSSGRQSEHRGQTAVEHAIAATGGIDYCTAQLLSKSKLQYNTNWKYVSPCFVL